MTTTEHVEEYWKVYSREYLPKGGPVTPPIYDLKRARQRQSTYPGSWLVRTVIETKTTWEVVE